MIARTMSINIIAKKEDSSEKEQEAKDEMYSLMDKAYYTDVIIYKIDKTTTPTFANVD